MFCVIGHWYFLKYGYSRISKRRSNSCPSGAGMNPSLLSANVFSSKIDRYRIVRR
jgi:hypothetical protein